jgi:hypothetical protein
MSSVVFTAGIWRFYGFLANQNMRVRIGVGAANAGDAAIVPSRVAMRTRPQRWRAVTAGVTSPLHSTRHPLKASDASPAVQITPLATA